jgi:hypothetical protein
MMTAKEIRNRLAGQTTKNVIVASSDSPYSLVHQVDYKGWFDEALAVSSFIIYKGDKFISSSATLNDALIDWDYWTDILG